MATAIFTRPSVGLARLDAWDEGWRRSRELRGAGRYREAGDVLEGLWESAPERRAFMWREMLACHPALDDLPAAPRAQRRAPDQGCPRRPRAPPHPPPAPAPRARPGR